MVLDEKSLGTDPAIISTPVSASSIEATETFSNSEYRKLIWKLDLRLLPPLFALWFISLIDRVNIGAARIQGLEGDLGIDPKGNRFNVATVVVFIGLMIAEVPSNWLIKKFSPASVLCGECLLLGIVTICQGLVQNFAGLVTTRFIIGLLEAGLIPGSIFLLASYYPRYELQWRCSMLHVGNALSNALGGLLAYAVAGIKAENGWKGWRWIFVIEGVLTVVVTLGCWPFMSNWMAEAKWLSAREKGVLRERIRGEGIVGRMDVLDRRAVVRCLKDWKVYVCGCIIIGIISSVYSITLFSPTIIKVLKPHYSAKQVQALVIPIFIASSISTLTIAFTSDKLKHRAGLALLGCALSIIGYIILLNQHHVPVNVRYGALFLVSAGSFAALPAAWCMLLNNVSGVYKTAWAVGMQIGLGNGGGFIASFSFQARDAPFYVKGFRTTFSLMCGSVGLIFVYVAGLWWENKQKREGRRDYLLREEGDNLGDEHPEFFFTY